MALTIADLGNMLIIASVLLVIKAVWDSMDVSEDERLKKFVKEQVQELFDKRLSIVGITKGRKIFWEDNEGRFTVLGSSNQYGNVGTEYMIFFKKKANILKIFPNFLADHICVRTTIANVKRVGNDRLVLKAIGFQPIDSYWYAITETMDQSVIKSLVESDRDVMMSDILRTEMVRIATTKIDSSLIARLSQEDLQDLESGLYSMENNKKKNNIEM